MINVKRLPRIYLLMMIFLIVSGCTVGVQSVELLKEVTKTVSVSKNSVTLTPTSQLTQLKATVTPTSSPTAITVTSTASPAASPTPFEKIDVRRIEISSIKPTFAESNGVIALHDWEIGQDIFQEQDTSTKMQIDPQIRFSGCLYVTPDRTRIACIPAGYEELQVRDVNRLVISRKMLPEAVGTEVGWVNNEQIGFVTVPQDKDHPLDEDFPYVNMATTFYNPYDVTEITIQPDYPDIQGLYNYYNLGGLSVSGVSYNPTLELAVYKAFRDSSYIVLWDRVANQEIAKVYEGGQFAYPQWSPDGDRVVVTGSNEPLGGDTELYLMSREDGLQQITDLGNEFQEDTEIFSIGWSPDGERVAFMFFSEKSECASSCIGILDLATQDVKLYSFPGYIIGFVEFPNYSLTWSPDSRQLLLNSNPDDREKNSLVIFDIDQQAAYEVAENARILGWMVAP